LLDERCLIAKVNPIGRCFRRARAGTQQ
jgi:hypothetical protein